jgi:hypothetical protein
MTESSHLRTRRAELEEVRFERDEHKVDEWHLSLPPVALKKTGDQVGKLARQAAAYLRAFGDALTA